MFRGILTGIALTITIQFLVMMFALLSEDERRRK